MILGVVGPAHYCDDEILRKNSSRDPDGRDAPVRELRKKLDSEGILMVHHEKTKPQDAWGYLFFDYQKKVLKDLLKIGYKGHLFLIILESSVVHPDNWFLQNHRFFDVVFTWDMNVLQNLSQPRYVRYLLANDLSLKASLVPFQEREKLCVMMAANKLKNRTGELYSERFRAIEWFKKNHPQDFDLYGPDWDRPIKKIAYKIRNIGRVFFNKAPRPTEIKPIYRGVAVSKRDVMSRYKFCLCYENARNLPGYITEKIFDCFLAGVIPVYLGWDRADLLIPRETFIDKTKFARYEDLYDYMKNISEDEYAHYIKMAQQFICSESGRRFDVASFAEIISSNLMDYR